MKLFRTDITRLLFIGIVFIFSCCSDSGGTEEPPIDQITPPVKAVAVLPANGEPLKDYEEVANDDTKVSVAFKWNAAQSAQSYILTIFEGATEVYKNTTNTLETKVELDKCKAYTWRVISKNETGQTNGDTFSFTTPGTPTGNFAPYAAEITIEFDAGTPEMSVSWIGKDEDGDQLTYDITVWENESVLMEKIGYGLESVDPLIFKYGENYIVKIVSRDTSGNFSISLASEEAPE